MYTQWGNIFNMGGLSGIPFTGRIGFETFASHVPENGNIVVLFGPHVAIDGDGTVGKYKRYG